MKKGKSIQITGLEKLMKGMNKEVAKIERKSMAGLIKAAILIRRDMESVSPKIPMHTGNLRASFYVVTARGSQVPQGTFKGKQGPQVESDTGTAKNEASGIAMSATTPIVVIGFGANYAHWVHENVDAKFQRPGSGPKFLEAAIKRNKLKILQTIAENTLIE